jgi:hypothetical protein
MRRAVTRVSGFFLFHWDGVLLHGSGTQWQRNGGFQFREMFATTLWRAFLITTEVILPKRSLLLRIMIWEAGIASINACINDIFCILVSYLCHHLRNDMIVIPKYFLLNRDLYPMPLWLPSPLILRTYWYESDR